MTPLNISTQDIYTRHTEERPSLKTLTVKTDSSFNKEFPLVWHFPSCFFTCQTTVILLVSIFPSVPPGLYDRGKGSSSGVVLSRGKWSQRSSNSPLVGRIRWEVAG